LAQAHPYIDEYFTMLAARMVGQHGYPLLPSGLFYSHGLLYTYLIALPGGFMSLFGGSSLLPADMIYRVPNLLISVGAMLSVFHVTRRWFGFKAGLFALALMVVYPHGIVWGARVRMYTMLYLVVPLLAYVFFRLAINLSNRRRVLTAVVLLGLALFVHNWVVLLVPPLLVGVTVIVWQHDRRGIKQWRGWLPWLGAMAGLVVLSLYVQSLGFATKEVAASQNRGAQGVVDALASRLNLAGGNTEFVNQFLIDNPFNLLIVAGVLLAGLAMPWLFTHAKTNETARQHFWAMSFLYMVFWGAAAEFVLLLDPFLKQPRYASPLLVLAFIIWGGWLALALGLISARWRLSEGRQTVMAGLLALLLLMVFGALSVRQVPRLFFEGLPAVGYDRAFQYIRQEAAPDAPVLSPLPAAGMLYLANPQYFIAQNATNTFVHTNPQGVLADRWAGAPWLKTVDQFKAMLKENPTVWLAIDQPSFETQFNAAWKQVMRQNTRAVWQEDGVTVYRADGLIHDTPTEPDVSMDVLLADKLKLVGYTRQMSPAGVRLILFWQVLSPPEADYTTFVHVRNSAGTTVAQIDVQPLGGEYPTSRWKAGELIPDEILLPIPPDLPADTYQLLVGLYRWDTLERLPVTDDKSGENAILLESIEIQPYEP
jgi:4-amino-4-deoxy-L-arabinose transferase-like glycosyltransferase